jgi:alkanesulfonate monooxygenase SsuD/methylene tetrahydromethanopterin reductase-like flavin-dependent oxidoreductase (luciferase family)
MTRKIHLALHPYGVGGPGQHGLWKDPSIAKNASIDINYYIRQAQAAEHALFDALFIVDSQFINSTYPAHYLNRLEPLTLLSAVATHTRDGINLAFRNDEDLTRFVDGVVPLLQKRGLYRTEYESDTLRGNLGLPIPVNRHTRNLVDA